MFLDEVCLFVSKGIMGMFIRGLSRKKDAL